MALPPVCLSPVRLAADKADLVRPFLETYCIKCHGEDKQKGDRRFDHLTGNPKTLDEAEGLQEVLDQLNLAEMPPEDEKQPKPEETRRVVTHLTEVLDQARENARENRGKVVLRRLNRVEYLNTIRDLFDLKMVDFDPTVTFPPDDSTEGFDNVGEGLVASGHLLQNYLDAARKVADKAIRPGPEPKMIHYQAGVTMDPNGGLGEASSDKDARRDAEHVHQVQAALGLAPARQEKGRPCGWRILDPLLRKGSPQKITLQRFRSEVQFRSTHAPLHLD